jgi:hemoglobin
LAPSPGQNDEVQALNQTIFERNGGFASVRKIVSTFYDYMLDDETMAPYFAGVDMRRQIDHQSKFISAVMGGPGSYSDDHLQRVHARLGIDHKAFAIMGSLLKEAMEDHDMAPADVDAVMHEIHIREHLVVTR